MLQPDESNSWRKLLGLPTDASAMQVCRRFERLAVAIAPIDLAGLPVYALPISAMPENFTLASWHSGGWYSDLGYYWAKPYLPNDRGAGPIFFVRDIRTNEDARNLALAAQTVYAAGGENVSVEELLLDVPPVHSIGSICGTLTHELGHVLDSLAEGNFQMWAEAIGRRKKRIDLSLKQFDALITQRQSETIEPPPQVESHGLRFTRIVSHLDFRLRSVGVKSESFNAAGERFEQREYAECYDALGDELSECRRTSFASILSRPMPEAFERCGLSANNGKAVA